MVTGTTRLAVLATLATAMAMAVARRLVWAAAIRVRRVGTAAAMAEAAARMAEAAAATAEAAAARDAAAGRAEG